MTPSPHRFSRPGSKIEHIYKAASSSSKSLLDRNKKCNYMSSYQLQGISCLPHVPHEIHSARRLRFKEGKITFLRSHSEPDGRTKTCVQCLTHRRNEKRNSGLGASAWGTDPRVPTDSAAQKPVSRCSHARKRIPRTVMRKYCIVSTVLCSE